MTTKFLIALCAAIGCAPIAAQAADPYFGMQIGRAHQQMDFGPFSEAEDSTAFKIVTGLRFANILGAEAGFVQHGVAEMPLSGTIMTLRPRSVYLAATATVPLSTQYALLGKLGVSYHRTGLSNFGGNTRSRSATTPMAGIGIAYLFTPAVSGVLEYEHFGKVVDDCCLTVKSNVLSLGLRTTF